MIASVTIAPRTSLAMCRGGLQGSPKLLTAARSLVNCRNCRRSQRAALPRDLTLRWIPRRRWQEPHPRTPSRTAGSEKTAARATARVAISVAVQHRATQSSQDRPRMLVQPEPIRTVATRAANAVGCNHPPGFKSPILRSSQNTQGQGLTHQATQGRDSGCRRAQHEAGRGSQRFINAKTPQPRYSRRYRAYRAGLDASSARISSASSW